MVDVNRPTGAMDGAQEQHNVPVAGVHVKFPCKPYSSQKQMMFKVIRSLQNREHALLESPTGTGKTLALLCSSLAWLQKEKQSLQPPNEELLPSSSEPQNGAAASEVQCHCRCHIKQVPIKSEFVKDGVPDCPAEVQGCRGETSRDTVSAPCKRSCAEKEKERVADEAPQTAGEVIPGPVGTSSVGHDEVDFAAPKKKYVNPWKSTRGKRKRNRGVVYEDSGMDITATQSVDPTLQPNSQGLPTWRMEMKNESVTTVEGQDSLKTSSTAAPESKVCLLCDCYGKAKEKQLETVSVNKKQKVERNSANRLPKIYFATRTHKQIHQVVHELSRTAYKDVRMTILASREHYCIHPEVSRSKSKKDECSKLIDFRPDCAYYSLHKRLSTQANIQSAGLQSAWDVEDLTRVGQQHKACPYFVSRSLKDEADIVFCPYNYIVEPGIRSSMDISIEGQVIIFDEGHNMEDSAREAASFKVTNFDLIDVQQDIDRVMDELKKVPKYKDHPWFSSNLQAYNIIRTMIQNVMTWMSKQSNALPHSGYQESYKVWYGNDIVQELQSGMEITPQTYTIYMSHLETILSSKGDFLEDQRLQQHFHGATPPTLSTVLRAIIEQLLCIVGYIYQEDQKYKDDFRTALSTVTVMRPKDVLIGHSRRRSRYNQSEKVRGYALHFWCMNPAIIFSELSKARSIILTSGTLSPMQSFSSELGMHFAQTLEAHHIIPDSQVLVKSISFGPNEKELLASYQTSESFEFQDELGALVLQICEVVPHGVLCFMSSYKMMDKLMQRWQGTGLLSKIEVFKKVLSEPRGSDKTSFDGVLEQFYHAIHHSSLEDTEDPDGLEELTSRRGALLFAVCRGKVSEGLDFADNNARVVITIGIPYPNARDKQVELKKEYNNFNCKRGLLNGNEWYDIQAYRALNQALGRCIRHRKDWGAILLVDSRFSRGGKYVNGLSKWVRKLLTPHSVFSEVLTDLSSFVADMSKPDLNEPHGDLSLESTLEQTRCAGLPTPNRDHVAGSTSLPVSPPAQLPVSNCPFQPPPCSPHIADLSTALSQFQTTPHQGTVGLPHQGTVGLPHQGTVGLPHQDTVGLPHQGTGGLPHQGTGGLPHQSPEPLNPLLTQLLLSSLINVTPQSCSNISPLLFNGLNLSQGPTNLKSSNYSSSVDPNNSVKTKEEHERSRCVSGDVANKEIDVVRSEMCTSLSREGEGGSRDGEGGSREGEGGSREGEGGSREGEVGSEPLDHSPMDISTPKVSAVPEDSSQEVQTRRRNFRYASKGSKRNKETKLDGEESWVLQQNPNQTVCNGEAWKKIKCKYCATPVVETSSIVSAVLDELFKDQSLLANSQVCQMLGEVNSKVCLLEPHEWIGSIKTDDLWDGILGLCVHSIKCADCSTFFGVRVLAGNTEEKVQLLVGKVLVPGDL